MSGIWRVCNNERHDHGVKRTKRAQLWAQCEKDESYCWAREMGRYLGSYKAFDLVAWYDVDMEKNLKR